MNTVLTVVASVLASTGIATVVMKFFVESALKEAQEKKKQEQNMQFVLNADRYTRATTTFRKHLLLQILMNSSNQRKKKVKTRNNR